MTTTAKQDAKAQRINALEQLVRVLRKQSDTMRVSLAAKDDTIENLRLQIKALQACVHNSVAIHR
jgi:hypothetical protein